MIERETVEQLTRMGLTEYQSKVYSALVSLGPSGVTDINRVSKVPRTKIYQVLEELILRGAIEFQPGRPIVYRAIRPSVLIKRMRDDYFDSTRKAETLLEEHYQTITNPTQDMVWIVRGHETARRKLAEILASAKQSIFAIESFEPYFLVSIGSLLKAAASKNRLKVRAVCVGNKEDLRNNERLGSDLIEYRALSASIKKPEDSPDEAQLLKSLSMAISSSFCLAVIDDLESFEILDNPSDLSRSIGLYAKIPGVSILQRIMFEKLIDRKTSRFSPR